MSLDWNRVLRGSGRRAIRPAIAFALVLGATPAAANLVVNGDFSSGNSGFSSGYGYIAGGQTGPGQYGVVSNPGTAFTNGYNSYGDHTTGTGLMLFGDGTGGGSAVWSQAIAVHPDSDYVFTAWYALAVPPNPPTLRVLVDGIPLGPDVTLAGPAGTWEKFTATWQATGATSITLAIHDVNPNPFAAGNDFTVDDISFIDELAAVSGVTDSSSEAPIAQLRGNSPNPFHNATRIDFELDRPGHVQLAILDVSGRLVRTLTDREWPAGRHGVTWNGEAENQREVPGGVYFCLFKTSHGQQITRISRLR